MIRQFFIRAFLVGVTCLIGSVGLAVPANEPLVKIEFSIVIGDGAAPVGAFIEGKNGAEIPLLINNSTRSPIYTSVGPFPLMIWGHASAGAPRLPVAVVNIAPDARRVLIVLMPAPKAQSARGSHVGLAVEDAWETNPAGSLRFFNFTGHKVAAQMRGQIVELSGGASKSIPIVTSGKLASTAEPVVLRLAQQEGPDFRLFYDGKVNATAQERIIALLIPPQVTGGLSRMRILRDALPKPVKGPPSVR